MTDLTEAVHPTDISQLKELLITLASERKDISIRLEIDGQSWTEYYSSVLVFSEHAILLTHMPTRTVIHISDLKNITGFQIDHPYKSFYSFHAYHISGEQQPINRKEKTFSSHAEDSF
jgi:hypothetical protein